VDAALDIGAYERGSGAGSQLWVSDVSVTEGNSGTVNAAFTVTLSPSSASTVTVNYATANGTATAGSDYTAASSTLTFSAGQTSKTVNVAVIGDTVAEANETFYLTLASPVNATIADGQGTGTIVNDDAGGVALSINNVSVAEGNSGTVNAVFTVTLSAASAQTVTVSYATANGTATAGSDYTATTGSLSFSAGTTSRTIAVAVIGDTAYEGNETFLVNLSSPVGATLADGQGQATIVNDDAAPPGTTVPVVWTAAVGVAVSGNSLTKTTATGTTAGAISTQQITSGDGYVEFTASEPNTYRMVGLSNGNTNTSYQDIDFGLDLAPGGVVYVFEKGVNRGTFGTYQTGYVFRVAVSGGVVRYSRNGVVFYTSTLAPTYPLLVDTWLYNLGATIKNAMIATGSAPPPPPPGGTVPVTWTAAVGVTVSGNSLTKVTGTGTTAGAISTQQITSGDGYVEFTASETNTYRMVGLSNGNTNTSYQDIDFGLDLAPGGVVYVFEKGVNRGTFGTYQTGMVFRVSVTGGVVRYSRNGVVFYTSTLAPTYPLLVDTWLYNLGATIKNANFHTGP
jgi:hypothetical protein